MLQPIGNGRVSNMLAVGTKKKIAPVRTLYKMKVYNPKSFFISPAFFIFCQLQYPLKKLARTNFVCFNCLTVKRYVYRDISLYSLERRRN